MGKKLVNTVITNPEGKANVIYNGDSIDQLDITIEDRFFDGNYSHLTDIPEVFPPDIHTHNTTSIVDIEDQFNIQINDAFDILLTLLRDDNNDN